VIMRKPRSAVGQGLAQELDHRNTRYLFGVLEGQEHPGGTSFVRRHAGDVEPAIRDPALGDGVRGVSHQNGCQCGFAGSVGTHQCVHLTAVHGEIHSLEDLRGLGCPNGGVPPAA